MNSKFMKNAFVGWTFTAGLYYPPDFDSTKLTPLKNLRPKGQQQAMNIRMMFPFTMICDSCGEYNYTGTKFTAKVEDIKHETYLGIKVYRFYGRCRHCWAEFTFKTDPKNSDYTMESGGKRTYEAWKDADMMEAQLKAEKEKEAELDQMKALEQKSVDVQAEMQRLEDLDAIRTMNKRLGARDQTIEEALEFLFKKDEKESVAAERLPADELAELKGFMEAQEERKRKALDDEVDGGRSIEDGTESMLGGSAGSSSSSSASAGGSSGSGSSAAATAASAGSSKEGAGSSKEGANAAGAAIAAAVAERAKQQASARGGLGARLSVKRKAVDDSGGEVAAKKAKEEVVAAASASGKDAGEGAKKEEGSGGGMGLLGAYDSDDSA